MKLLDNLLNLFKFRNRRRGRKKQHFKISLFKKIGIKLREIIDIIFPLLIIAIGCIVTVYLHYHRFIADGNPWYIATLFGAGLTFLIAVLSMLFEKRRTKPILLLLITVMAYSILSTSAGQTISLQKKESDIISNVQDKSKKIIDDQIAQLKIDIAKLQTDYDIKNQYIIAKKQEFIDKYDYYDYNRTIPGLEKERDKIASEKKSKEDLLIKKQDELTQSVKTIQQTAILDIYEFYGSMLSGKWSSRDWLIFGFHTAFSVVVELMIPFGIFKLNVKSKKGRKKDSRIKRIGKFFKRLFTRLGWFGFKKNIYKPKEPKEKIIISDKELRMFASIAWTMRTNQKTDFFPKGKDITFAVGKVCPEFSAKKFDMIAREGIKKGLLILDKPTGKLYPAPEINSDVFYREYVK